MPPQKARAADSECRSGLWLAVRVVVSVKKEEAFEFGREVLRVNETHARGRAPSHLGHGRSRFYVPPTSTLTRAR